MITVFQMAEDVPVSSPPFVSSSGRHQGVRVDLTRGALGEGQEAVTIAMLTRQTRGDTG